MIPLGREQQAFTAMMADSLAEDRHSPVPGLVHRYPDRVLMLITTQCASYCRYCTRSRIVGDPTQNFNRRDHEAWSSSIAHIRSTPGFPMEDDWPSPKSLEENLADLEEHAADFDAGRGFTYTVLEPVGERVIGCVYLYPDPTAGADVHVRSWVRSSHAHLDAPLWSTVSTWIERDWPFRTVSYAPRDH